MKTSSYDAVVIGAGIGGALAAYRLAANGKKVVVLDQGLRLDRNMVHELFQSESFIGNPMSPTIPVTIQADGKRYKKQLTKVVGGLARFFAGVTLRMRETEFSAWPISYEEIEPYYSEAERLMHVSGLVGGGGDPTGPYRSVPFPLKLPSMSRLSRILFDGAARLGCRPFQHPMAIDFEKNCIRCNFCNQVPCDFEAKWNPDTFLRAYEGERLEVRPGQTAVRIHWENGPAGKLVKYVEVVDGDGETVHYEADNFVLAAGAIQTPALLIKSKLHEENPSIGRNLMTHCLALVVGFFPFQISAENDFHKWFSVSDYYFDDRGRVRGLIQQDHLTTRKKIFSKTPKWLHPLIGRFYYNTCQLLVIAEDEPRMENRVELRSNENDGGLLIRKTFSKEDREKRDYLSRKAKKILREAGALLTFKLQGQSVYHACGTVRMGKDPTDSATDLRGKVWGLQNLYVTDASVFPTSSGVNPSLTIAANALRIADLIQ